MQNAAQAYGAVARQIANPRELEADLLLKAASQLQAVYDGWDRKRSDSISRCATIASSGRSFSPSVTSPEHALAGGDPPERRQSRPVRHEPDRLDAERTQARTASHALININRELAAGLLGRA